MYNTEVLLWCRKLMIQHCHYSSLVCCCGRGFIPGWRTSTCHRHRQKKKKKTQTQNQVRQFLILYYHKWCCNVHSVHMSPGICMIISLEQISRDKRAGSYSMLLGTAKQPSKMVTNLYSHQAHISSFPQYSCQYLLYQPYYSLTI